MGGKVREGGQASHLLPPARPNCSGLSATTAAACWGWGIQIVLTTHLTSVLTALGPCPLTLVPETPGASETQEVVSHLSFQGTSQQDEHVALEALNHPLTCKP